MRELENCQPHMILSSYEYREEGVREQKDIERNATVEYKKDMLDPTRKVVEWERKMAHRRRKR
jgi:hypothetical protein